MIEKRVDTYNKIREGINLVRNIINMTNKSGFTELSIVYAIKFKIWKNIQNHSSTLKISYQFFLISIFRIIKLENTRKKD